MATDKITLKNIMVYDFMRNHYTADEMSTNVKSIFNANKDEISKRFGIKTYATFNFHIRKVLNWEAKAGNNLSVIRMDNREVK